MQFRAMNPMKEGFPIIEVGEPGHQFDLHNDGDLREISYSWVHKTFRIAWTLKVPAWRDPDQVDSNERRSVASVALVFSGIRDLSVEGPLPGGTGSGESRLDFIEYHRQTGGVGEVRIVLLTGTVILVHAIGCELQTTSAL